MHESNTQVESVKELRALHYSLFIFSCMLIVAVAATKDLHLSKALTQITQIQELTHNWDNMRRKLFLDTAYSKNKIFKPDVSVGVLFSPILDADRIDDVIAVDQNEITSFNTWQFQPPIMQNPPSTLAEFRAWWNTLHAGLTIYSPIKIEPPLFFDEKKTCRITVSRKGTNAVSNDEGWGDCWIARRTEGDVGSKVSWSDLDSIHSQNPKNTVEVVYLDLNFIDDGESHRTVKVDLPFVLSPTKVDETEMQRIYSDWRPGDYNKSFPELLV